MRSIPRCRLENAQAIVLERRIAPLTRIHMMILQEILLEIALEMIPQMMILPESAPEIVHMKTILEIA